MTNASTTTTFYVGLNDSNMDDQTVKPEDVINSLAEMVQGGTFTESRGLWKGETEKSLKFEVANIAESLTEEFEEAFSEELDDGKPAFKCVKERIEEEFNQESVMVKRQTAGIHF